MTNDVRPADAMGDTLPCLTLWQPWAAFVALEDKEHETRGFPAPRTILGRRIGIHAAQRVPDWRELRSVHRQRLVRHGLRANGTDLPLGAIVCTAVVADCHATTDVEPQRLDRELGDWRPGRFAWRLEAVHRLPAPIRVSGQQSVWYWPIPPALDPAVLGFARP